jgi:hypothetical protein
MREVADALDKVLGSLQRQGVRCMLGGSIASSVHGIHRSTRDIDIVAAIDDRQTARLAAELGPGFYMDAEEAAEALRRGRSFNIIHIASSYKFDIFPLPDDPYYRTQIERSEPKDIAFDVGVTVRCPVATAEDTVLSKLVWYRAGGEQSDQQWNDLRGVRAIQGNRLDRAYLEKWARHLRVDDLLHRLLTEEGAL